MRPGVRVGVDVGAARVGLALCDAGAILATPVASHPAADDPVGAVADLAAAHEAIEIVVGLPRSLSGAEGPAAALARDFAREVARRVRPLPVRLFDERLSTVQAHRALHESGRPGRRHRDVVDQVAAVTILQAALEAERTSGRATGELIGGRKPRAARVLDARDPGAGAPRPHDADAADRGKHERAAHVRGTDDQEAEGAPR